MSLVITEKKTSNIPLLESKSYSAVCTAAIHIGEQFSQYDKQKQGKYVNQCIFIFEISSERVEIDGESKPRWIATKRMNALLGERSALGQFISSWCGEKMKTINLADLLGKGAILAVSQKETSAGSKYNSIESITGIPDGIPIPKPESELLAFDADEPDMGVLEKLPTWIQDLIKKSTQFAENPPMQEVAPPENTTNKQQSNEDDGEECPI